MKTINIPGLIKDTELWESYRITVELTDDAPEVNGFRAISLDVERFRPRFAEFHWTRKNGAPWQLYSVELRDTNGYGSEKHFRKLEREAVSLVPWLPELAAEVAPKQ